MKIKTIITSLLVFTIMSSYAQEKKSLSNIGNQSSQAEFKFENEEVNFGTIKQGESVTREFKFTNVGNEPLIITNAEGSCGCTVPIFPKEPILKNQTGVIKVTFNSAGKFGIQDKTVTITSNAVQSPMVLHVKGIIEKAPVEKPNNNNPN
jgi:hypothetical protein